VASQKGRQRTGRRPGESGSREAIADAARHQFAERGYGRATIRGIAADAGVDPALISHFFGSKRELFNAVTTLPFDLDEAMPQIVAGPRSKLGERLAEWLLGVLDDPESRRAITGIVRAAASEPEAAQAAREVVSNRVLVPIAEAIDADQPKLRASLINSQMVGLIMARYIVALEPLASLPGKKVVQAIAPNLQRYLTAPLERAARDPSPRHS
jgi:AcrR family transcriptional regulator